MPCVCVKTWLELTVMRIEWCVFASRCRCDLIPLIVARVWILLIAFTAICCQFHLISQVIIFWVLFVTCLSIAWYFYCLFSFDFTNFRPLSVLHLDRTINLCVCCYHSPRWYLPHVRIKVCMHLYININLCWYTKHRLTLKQWLCGEILKNCFTVIIISKILIQIFVQ